MNIISKEDRGRLARLITRLQDSPDSPEKTVVDSDGNSTPYASHVVGISGVGGAGKSTLIAQMLPILRAENLRVIVLAIDPTSNVSKGALLGDRIRMRDSYGDEGIFIRSLATRGASEALTVSLPPIIQACSKSADIIIVETAGAGQIDIGIHRLVDTFVSVIAPLGDSITLMKSGQTEHAHIIAVNMRAGLSGGELFLEQARAILVPSSSQDGWQRSLFSLDADRGEGINHFVHRGVLAHGASIQRNK